MRVKLPFVGRIFWKVLAVVLVLVVLTFVILIGFTDYELTSTDAVGALISLVIFSYLVHLWLLPGEHAQPQDGPLPDDQPQADEQPRPDEEETL